jgi:16S rRNA (uracil1498-N3)-methyltransferase
MQLRRFVTERTKLRVGSSVKILDEEAYHIRKSLRLQPDDEIILFNGENEFKARLKIVSKEVVMADIVAVIGGESEDDKPKFTLIQSLIRASNLELIFQKTTELGVDSIVPVFTEFSQINLPQVGNKLARWQKIVVEACKQSERISIPQIAEPIEFKDLKNTLAEFDLVLFFTLKREATADIKTIRPLSELTEQIKMSRKVAYLIGPEGGFSPNEHKLAANWGLEFVALEGNVLKAETAAIAAQAILSFLAE